MNIAELEPLTREELLERARDLAIPGVSGLRKQDLIFKLLQAHSEKQGHIFAGGVIDIVDDGYGFLRGESLLPTNTDVYVSQSQVRRFGLRTGDYVTGQVRAPKEGEKYYGLQRVDALNGNRSMIRVICDTGVMCIDSPVGRRTPLPPFTTDCWLLAPSRRRSRCG